MENDENKTRGDEVTERAGESISGMRTGEIRFVSEPMEKAVENLLARGAI